MALNIQTLKTRSASAALFVVVMLLGMWAHKTSFLFLFLLIHLGCWWEFRKLFCLIYPSYKETTDFHAVMMPLMGSSFLLLAMGRPATAGAMISFHELGWWLLLICILLFPLGELIFAKKVNGKNYLRSLLGLIYVSGGLSGLIFLGGNWLQQNWNSPFWLPITGLVFGIWINDTMAYLVGSILGKTPLSSISPKKTWEGTIGGALLSLATVLLLGIFTAYGKMLPPICWAGIALIAAVGGTVGDLLESKMKRLAQVKDSGNVLPGHGGFLDRFDSLLVAAPLAALWMLLLTLIYS